MVLARVPVEKLQQHLIGTTVDIYAPFLMSDGRFLDRIDVEDIQGHCICGTSHISGKRESYDVQDYIDIIDVYEDHVFHTVDQKYRLEDLYTGKKYWEREIK
jgi:hypothetical protein